MSATEKKLDKHFNVDTNIHFENTDPNVECGLLTLHLSSVRLPELHIAVRAED